MLKFFFWILVLANTLLFGYQRGYFDALMPSGHEPARISKQLNADKIKVVPAPAASKAASPAVASAESSASASQPAVAEVHAAAAPVVAAPVAAAPATVAPVAATAMASPPRPGVEKKVHVTACTEIGNFNAEDAKRFSAQLASLSLGQRVTQRAVREIVSHIVYIPPQADKEAAEKKAEELRNLGIDDFFIIQDNSNLRWGISLGVFKQEEAARTHLANLNQKGVRNARVGERSASRLVAFQVRELDDDKKAALDKIRKGFPKQEMRACEAA